MASPQPATIRILDDATIDRIAAGEVIERPASVVKELVENALDAGARQLRVEILEGGLALLRVEDDGCGIRFSDLPLAFERHATSKIGSAADILQVGTFGFRGEALAAIASVSRCEAVSRAEEEEVGGRLTLVGGEVDRREPAPRNRGTTVTVSDLFYNTPARRKYLSSAAAERRAVVRMVTRLALAHPEVRWQLRADGQTVLDLLAVDSLPARARDLLGQQTCEHLARFERTEGGLSVGGLASRPTWTRGNRQHQFFFVNRRPVESRTLYQAIFQAYQGIIPPGRHPVVVLFLQVPVGEVDVNVHPAKSEVRLLMERRVFGLVRSAVQQALGLRGGGDAEDGAAEASAATWTGPESGSQIDLSPTGSGSESPLIASGAGSAAGGAAVPDTDGQEPESSSAWLAEVARAESDFMDRQFGSGRRQAEKGGGGPPTLFPGSGRPAATSGQGSDRAAPFWQLHRTYILSQIRGALVIIDQHASHERILYDEARRALAHGGTTATQQLLFPAHLELTPGQLEAFAAARQQLLALGFLVQPFGGQSVIVQGIPASLKNWRDGQLLLDLLDDLSEYEAGRDSSRDQLLASYACHAAIRAGEPLSLPEMQNLFDQLFATDAPLSCPHGRPTLIQISLTELARRFGRH
jgi:DNA mismatch repair protein MutL